MIQKINHCIKRFIWIKNFLNICSKNVDSGEREKSRAGNERKI